MKACYKYLSLLITLGFYAHTSNGQSNSWTQKSDFPGSSYIGAVGFSAGTRGYISLYNDSNGSNEFWEFDPVSDVWSQKANFGGSARRNAVGFSIGNQGYIGTGNDVVSSQNLMDFWAYDPLLNVWTQKADVGLFGRDNAVGFSVAGKGYIGTGFGAWSLQNDFWEYDPGLNTWTEKAEFGGEARRGAVGFAIGNKGYMGTGQGSGYGGLSDFWEFDPSLNTWTQKSDLSGPARTDGTGFSVAGKGYIASGGYDDFWEYDPQLDNWTKKEEFPGTPRRNAIGFSIGGKGYLGTADGTIYSQIKDFWEYTPDGFLIGIMPRVAFCTGSSIDIPFTISQSCSAGNIYTAELSDSLGNFSNAVVIGSLAATGSGVISGTIPNETPDGSKYKVRVASSNPEGHSIDNLIDLVINGSVPQPAGLIDGTLPGCFSRTNTYSVSQIPNALSYHWTIPPGTTSNGSNGNTIWLKYNAGSISGPLVVKGHNECGDGDSSVLNLSVTNCGDNWVKRSDAGWLYRFNAVGFSIGGKGYFGTGTDLSFSSKKDFWEYNPVLNAWTQKADCGNSARSMAVGFSIGNKGYVGTGSVQSPGYSNEFWEYDPLMNIWTQKADFEGSDRQNATGLSIGNKGYVGLGFKPYEHKKDFWEYDPALNTWTQKTDFGGVAREQATGLSIGNKGYIGTGYNNSKLKDFWEYDPMVDTWIQKTDFGGIARKQATGFSIGSKGYLGTGYGIDYHYLNDFWEYNPTSDTWMRRADFGGTPRNSAIGFSIGNCGYIGTGVDDAYKGKENFWEYRPEDFSVGHLKTNSLCVGASLGIPFIYPGACNPGNVFEAQLSDSAGSFSNPVSLGQLSSILSGTILATIPSGIPQGTKYRIRVVSSNPYQLSKDNLIDLYISTTLPSPAAAISGTLPGCLLTPTTYSVPPIQNALTYKWTIPQGITGNNSAGDSIVITYGKGFTSGSLSVNGRNGCGNGPSSVLPLSMSDCGGYWQQKSDLGGESRYTSTGFSIGGKGYIGTGQLSTSGRAIDFREFDPVSDTGIQRADFVGGDRYAASGFSIGGKGYFGTGNNGSQINQKDFWEFDPKANTWTQKADFGGSARRNAVGFSVGSKGYIGTGNDGSNRKDFWEFDPATNTWVQKADFGGAGRKNATGFSILNKGYLGTGWTNGYTRDFWEFDPISNTWVQKADFGGTARDFATGFSIGDKGYLGIGFESFSMLRDDFWEYDPITNAWTQKPEYLGGPRAMAVGFSIGSKGYICTGFSRGGRSHQEVYEYTPEGFRVGLPDSFALCSGGSISIPFTYPGACNSGNIFTAQLSDSLGSFSSPVEIGSLTGTSSGTIAATIPSGTSDGFKYRIRVTASSPAIISSDNLIDIVIHHSVPGPAGIISGTVPGCITKTFSYAVPLIPDALSYRWSIPSGLTGNNSEWNSLDVTYDSGFISGMLTVKGSNGCGYGDSSVLNLSATACGDYWIRKADVGGAKRTSATGFSIAGKGYIGTGYTYQLSADFWEFDPILNSWAQKADFGGTARAYATAFAIGNKGYVGTGFDGKKRKDFWEFDPQQNIWTQKADFGGTARSYAAGFSVNGKGYLGTGNDGSNRKDFWEYDPTSNTWAQKADFSGAARLYAAGFSIGSKGYMGTGNLGSVGYATNTKDFWEYDPALGTWARKADFGGDIRQNMTGFSIGDRGYLLNGRGAHNNDVQDFWEFDPSLNTWTRKQDYAGATVSGTVGFSIGNKGYVGTGQNQSYGEQNEFWEYTPDHFSVGILERNSFCKNMTMKVPFIYPGSCNPGNVFTAQLSDSSGNFANPATLGTLAGTISDTIECAIPLTANDGKKYRIRVVSSDPPDVSFNNLVDISINQAVPIAAGTISGPSPACLLHPATFTIPLMADAVSYQWRIPGGISGNGSTGNSVNLTFSPAFNSGYLSVNGTNACGNGDTSIMTLSVTNCGDNWVRKSDFIGPRTDATGFSIGNKGYIGAGMNAGTKKDFWEFDPILNIWTQKADIGKKTRQGGTGFSIGKKGYFGIGYNGNFRKDWWEYDPVLNVWTQRADFAGTGRTEAVGFAIGNSGYLGTGRPEAMSYLKDFWEFDPDANEWLQKADFGGTARYGATGFSISNSGYLGIGIDAANTGTKDFWAYDPALDIWTKMADFGGEPRLNAVGFSIGQKGYIGTGSNFNNGVYTYQDFWEYDPTSNFWTRKADFSGSQRTNATGFSIGNKGFIGTSYDPNGTEPQDFWEYTPDGFRPGLLADNLFCGGIPLKIPFTVTIPMLPGNVFTAQLSDSLGNFTNPVEIGNVSGIYSDTIGGVLPVVATNGARYRIRVTSSSPAGTSTDILYDLSVFSPTQAGMVSGSKTISLGSSTDTLKLNGYTGGIVKWQKQLDGGGFGDISQTPGLICYLETPTETGTWEFRAMIKNGTCGTELSTPAAVTVVHGPILRQWTGMVDDRWNEPGNWNPSGAPGPQDDAIIPATASYMPVVRANGYSCNNILIQLGASCTVNPGITLTVNGLVTIEGQ